MTVRILLPSEFQDVHRRAVLAWVRRGHEFNLEEWRSAMRAFDLLREAAIVTQRRGILPFPAVYYRYVEEPHARDFIQLLRDATDIEPVGIRAWARIARMIPTTLRKVGLVDPHQPATRLLVAHCLYWWYAFAYGYIFEVQVLRDLERSGVEFSAHDLTVRQERLSSWDLEVLGFRGDIKRSLSFLQTVRGKHLPHAFYIVRLRQTDRSRILVVMMRRPMWDTIDGETLVAVLDDLPNVLPGTARIRVAGVEIVVADYALWKRLVIRRQSDRTEANDV
jgi:hypothetical protein